MGLNVSSEFPISGKAFQIPRKHAQNLGGRFSADRVSVDSPVTHAADLREIGRAQPEFLPDRPKAFRIAHHFAFVVQEDGKAVRGRGMSVGEFHSAHSVSVAIKDAA